MTSPVCQVKDGSGAWQSTEAGVNVTPGNTVTIGLIDTSARIWMLACIGAEDMAHVAPTNASLVVNSLAKTATFTAPASGRALLFQSVVENGRNPDGTVEPSYATTFALYTTDGGNRVIAVGETMQSDATNGYATRLNRALRLAAPAACGMRLSLTSGTPVTTTDVTGASTLYLTPHVNGLLSTYDGGIWVSHQTDEVPLVLSGLTSGKNYDVFAYWTGAAILPELSAAWTNDTTRADALARQDGVYVKAADHSRLHVGTIRATGTTTTEDSVAKRFVANRYNAVARPLRRNEAADSWTYGSRTFRAANNSAANCFEVVTCDVQMLLATVHVIATGDAAGLVCSVGIGIDSTTVNSAQLFGATCWSSGGAAASQAHYRGFPGLGYHKVTWLESADPTVTFYGDLGIPADFASGMLGEIEG